jgi:hypothetical protein
LAVTRVANIGCASAPKFALSHVEIASTRLDYSRRFDQSKMPEWRDPRGA